MRVRELAEALQTTFEGDGELEITGAAPLDSAGAADITFVGNRKAAVQAGRSAAGCLVVPDDFENSTGRTVIRKTNPRTAFAAILSRLFPVQRPEPTVHPSAAIAATASLDPSCAIGPHVTVGSHSKVGARSVIGPGCALGSRVSIGEDCVLHAHVTLYEGVALGNRVVLHAGCVLGADGFGFVLQNARYEKFPQVGRVVIEDDVEIGANSCVDRAALGVTSIGQGTKLDNMVHVGHNCTIGRHVVIAAQTGLSGGVTIEDYAVIGGQVGVGDKARIESKAVVGSGSGILTSKIVRGGQTVWGTPARPLKEYLEMLANLSRVPELREQVKQLRRDLERRFPEE